MTATDWHSKVSKPSYEMKVQRGVQITARDGTRLACDVYLPDAAGRFPALLSYSHYGKDLQRFTGKRSPLNPLIGNGGQEAGDSEYFVSRGYAHVIADARGSGDSEGEYCYQGPKEQQDGYDIIEWMAAQPWCDGNCGMFGMSYFAVMQYMVAAQQPPHLKAIVPYEALTDRYRQSVYHGGILNEGFWHQWWGHVSVDGMRPLSYDTLSEEEIARRVALLMDSPEVRHSPYLHIQLKYPRKNPLLFDWLLQPFDGPFYWERSPYRMFDRIKIPTFLATRWTSWAVHLAGAFEAYARIDAPKKLLIMETESRLGPLRPWADHQDLILRWYDHWLKGKDTGFMDEPPIRLLIKGKNEYRDEFEWPLARTRWTKMFLGPNAMLSASQPRQEGTASFSNDPDLPPNQHAPGVSFTSAPFYTATEVTGPVALYLNASLDQPDATWIVTVRDVAPDGTSHTVTKGWLRASQRELDAEKSRPYQPYQKHERRETLEPGRSYAYAIEIRETSNVFLPGHRIALDVKGQDTTAEDPIWVHTCNAIATGHTVQFGGKFDSYLLLPVIPD
ncbi:MAG: CocE/NonD family hydrolase [Betaproteobacteria bacterium]|nr:CocE/NonD family hydrolase [Betaproteobacteria bacterium]